MTAPGAWAAAPPEVNSAGFWLGPGAETMMAGAAQLDAIAAALVAMLGGHEAVATALGAAWPDPTGSLAVLSNVPNLLWQAQAAAHLTASSALIQETAAAFETLKAATPNPGEIAENQAENVSLNASNILGLLTPLIMLNRAVYGAYWLTAASNKYAYAAASATGVQAIPPMPPPTPSATPVASPSAAIQTPGDNSANELASSPTSALQSLMPALSQVGSLGSSMGGGGGGMSSLASLPQQALTPMLSMASGMGSMGSGSDGLDGAMAGSWLTAPTGGGGAVAANLSAGGGGGGGFGGLGSTALRGPVSWASSTVTSSSPATEATQVSRLAEARAAAAAPGTSAGMGGSGAMMGPMMAGSHNDQDKAQEGKTRTTNTPLSAVATLYREPTGIPVITGSGGANFHLGEVADGKRA